MCRDLTPIGDRRTWDGDDGSDTMKSDPKNLLSQEINKGHPLHLFSIRGGHPYKSLRQMLMIPGCGFQI